MMGVCSDDNEAGKSYSILIPNPKTRQICYNFRLQKVGTNKDSNRRRCRNLETAKVWPRLMV